MKIILEKENFLKSNVRDIIAINPLVSIRKMQEMVERNTGRPISDKYVVKLMHKVRREALIQSDRKKLNVRLAEVRERYRVLMENLNRTIYWKRQYFQDYGLDEPTYAERLQAIKLIAKLDLDLFKAELSAGMFEDRRIAVEEMLQQGVLPTELREQVVGVFRTWKYQTPKNLNEVPL